MVPQPEDDFELRLPAVRQESAEQASRWKKVYLSVVAVTVTVILLLWWFSRAFTP